MSAHFCPGCGTEHHWMDCPEVCQSTFEGEDAETVVEELNELLSDLLDPAYRELLDPSLRRMARERLEQLVTAVGEMGAVMLEVETFDAARRWLDGGPLVDPSGPRTGQGLS